MRRNSGNAQTTLEIVLILICLALFALLHRVGCYRMVVLNLFYLPVVLAGFFLGRYRAGVLALLAVICAAVVMALDLDSQAVFSSPLVVGLAMTTWAAAMGINAIFVGTVSDERIAKIAELHDAYLGVVEVLAEYLNSADPRLGDRVAKTAEISRKVASQMRLSDKEIDDIRVAALSKTSTTWKSRRGSFARPSTTLPMSAARTTPRTPSTAAISFSRSARCSQARCRCWPSRANA